jgi:hypothetical protein
MVKVKENVANQEIEIGLINFIGGDNFSLI